jgi:hypothetical protein
LTSRPAESTSDTSELTGAVIRDVTPLLGPLYWQAMRMTATTPTRRTCCSTRC